MKLEEAKENLRIIREQNEPDDAKSISYVYALEAIETVLQALENSISKDKVKEKIEKLDKEYKEILSDYGNIDTDITFNISNENVRKHLDELVVKIIVLQELLEDK